MKTITLLIVGLFLLGCPLFTEQVAPVDYIYHPPVTQPAQQDTCVALIEYTEPQFITLYMKFDEPQDSVLWEGGGIQSYDLAEVVTHITGLSAKIDTAAIGASVILKGSNSHQDFQLKIFTRIGGAKWYMGTATQSLILPGATASYYKELIDEYPSFNVWSFWGVIATCEEAIALCREVLKDCREGRFYADLFFMPCDAPVTVIDSLELYGWERIRHIQQPNYIADLRSLGEVEDAFIKAVAKSGKQIIVNERS